MMRTKFGIAAYALYLLAGLGFVLAAIIVIVAAGNNLQTGANNPNGAGAAAIAAFGLGLTGFILHGVHDAIVEQRQLLGDIHTALTNRPRATNEAASAPPVRKTSMRDILSSD